jgi:osmotically-inducible protein OsmY
MKTKLFVSIALIMVFLMANGATAQKVGKLTDDMVKTFVEYRLIKNKLLVNDNIQVAVANKVVTLTGVVPSLDGKKCAGAEAQKVEESYTIVNNLTVQESSLAESKIAENVMKRIQGYMFYTVFDWVTVEVNKGVVTLSGWAYLPWTASQIVKVVEKVEGVQSVNNQIQKESGSDEIRIEP